MSSTFLGLNTAYTGLQAANAALNTTSNNISNAETKGYSRQLVTTQAADAIRSFTSYGCVGAGVETLAIERVRDNFYDEKFWANNSKLGGYETKKYYMACIEEYYCDDDAVKGFNTIFNDFYGTIEELAKNPDDTTVRKQAIAYAGNVTSYFNDMYTNLRKLQDDVNQEIKVNIDRINSIAQEMASLNKQINVIEMNTGAMANELRDQRDLLVDELSEIATVEVTETDIIDANDSSRDTGGTRYMVKICGQTIVDGNYFSSLVCVPRANNEAVNQTDTDGLYDVFFKLDDSTLAKDMAATDEYGNPKYNNEAEIYRAKGDQLNMYASTVGGKLGGLVAVRDGNNGEGFTGTVTSVDTNAQTVVVEVSKDYLIDLNKLNLTTTGGVINIGDTLYSFSDWTYEYTEGDTTAKYTFVLDKDHNTVDITQNAATKKQTASVGPSIDYQGIPYYLSQMNEWVRMYSTAANAIERSGVMDDGTRGIDMFMAEDTQNGGDSDYDYSNLIADNKDLNKTISISTIDDSTTMVSYRKEDGTVDTKEVSNAYAHSYFQLTAGNFRISEVLEKDAHKLSTRSEQYSGADDNDIVEKMIDLKTNTAVMSFRGCSADQYLVCMLSDVSLNAQRANDFTSSYKVLQKSIDNQRLSVSGVDNDEEAVNLTKFQQQYNMASKMIQVLSEVYDRLILQTGV